LEEQISPSARSGAPTEGLAVRWSAEQDVSLDLRRTAAGVELTVISITQSIVLGILAAVAVQPILELRIAYWPSIGAAFAMLGWLMYAALGGGFVLVLAWWVCDSARLMVRRGSMVFQHMVDRRLTAPGRCDPAGAAGPARG